ncbi:hypothetical protein BJ508DRAFT_97851 [Ascobolus immersus RN42]|uniref:Uncharacterized protein n=1 Tax=Ascobolus immersus RN42 TaxID=1160509 RepID=A0A3N4IMC2_ASCIM|nr:hypothetical protein BJ508DRAFT_97851 [Ascobolus immersus RN42]
MRLKPNSDPIVRMASAIAPLSEHVAAYEDMDISLDFSDTETQTADKAEKENTFQKDEVFTVTDAASTMEASGQKDESSTSANLEREISEAPTPRFPSGAHVWRTVSDDEPSTSTGEKARMDGGVDPSFIDIMSKSNGPVTMDHPSVPTPTERLKIVDDDAEDNTNVDTNLQDQMEILDDDHKPAYESEKDGYTEQEDTPSIASHPIDINDVCGAHLVGDNQALSESGYVQDFSLLEKSAASEEKSIEDLLAEKQEQFNQEMRASDIAGNMEPFIQEEAQAAFVFRDVSPPSLGAEPNYDDLDTNKGPRTEPAPISHEAESSSRYSKAAREISEIPSKDPQSTANGPREQLAESTARLPEEASPMAEKYNTTQLETVALTREPSLMPEVRESATAEPIVLDEQETAEDALRKKRHPTVEEVIDDADIKFLSEKVAPVPDHENAQSHESAEATSEIAHYPEPTNDEAPDDANVVLNATHSSKAEDTAMAEANDTSEPPAESDLALEQNAVQAERSSYDNEKTELQEEKELDREVEEGKEVEDPMAGSMHVNGTTTTSIRITTTQIAYRAVIDEDVPTTVLSVKAFDAEVLETTGPTDFQLPPAPEFHMPDPGPFEVEDKEDDLESVDVGWNGPDSPTTGTTEIYIRETKEEEQSAFDVEILRDEEAPASEDEAEKFADADDAEASNSGEVSEEYVDAEEDDLEEKEVFADAEGIADAEEAEQFTDASEEASGDEEEQGSVYEDQPETADEDETTAKQTKSTPKKTAHRATTEEDTRETSVESGRDEDEEFLSINVDLARAEPLGPKTASSTHDKEAELVTPTRSTFAVVIESPTGPPKRRASVASHVEIDATPSVVIGEHISPQPKKRKRESEEPEEKAQQKSTKVAGGSPSRAKTDIVEIEQDAEHEVEEEMEQEPAEDDELEQHQKDIVNDVFDNDNDAAEFPASTDEGMELRDGKVLPPATSEKSDDGSEGTGRR